MISFPRKLVVNFNCKSITVDDYMKFYNTRRLQRNPKDLTPTEFRNQTLVT
ncbi:MAG: IS3 family transposase [Clostridia bacterium]